MQRRQQVIFTPGEYCGMGYPEWESADVNVDRTFIASKPCGVVTIMLMEERE